MVHLDPYVKVCFESFSADWKLVKTDQTEYHRYKPDISVYDRHCPYFYGDSPEEQDKAKRETQNMLKYSSKNALCILQNPGMHNVVFGGV